MRAPDVKSLKHWRYPLSIILMSAAASFTGTHVARAFRYERTDILHGELWRLLSGNLVHADFPHWMLNMIGFGALWFFYHKFLLPLYALLIVTLCALGTTLGLLLLNPQLQWYVGLSGALHGFIVAGALYAINKEPKLQLALLALVSVKLIMEQWDGPLSGTRQWISVAVAVDAHLYGALSGLFIGIGCLLRRLWRKKAS